MVLDLRISKVKMSRLDLVFLFLCLNSTSLAKTFEKCELASELRRQQFPEHQIKNLVCVIGLASSFRTHVIGGPDKDGSHNYGLFQINDRYWCSSGSSPGNKCNVRCSDLLSDDISLSSACAKTILQQRGLDAWVSWEFCKTHPIPELNC